jgi:hypothetical protein
MVSVEGVLVWWTLDLSPDLHERKRPRVGLTMDSAVVDQF